MILTALQSATSATQNLATGVTVQTYAASAGRVLWPQIRLSGLNGAAATFTVKIRNTTDTKDVDGTTYTKPTAAHTAADICCLIPFVAEAKSYAINITSSNASDTSVGVTVEWYDATQVDVIGFGGTAGTFSGGRPEVNTTHAAGTAWGSGAITAASIASNAITAVKIAADAITDAKVASDVTIASVTGAVGSVTGAVGSVTGSVGSVVGAVGSVTGNVGGNVTGSVGSISGVTFPTGFGTLTVGAIQSGLSTLTAGGVRTELTTELGRIDAAVSSRLATAGYTAPDNAGIAAVGVVVTANSNTLAAVENSLVEIHDHTSEARQEVGQLILLAPDFKPDVNVAGEIATQTHAGGGGTGDGAIPVDHDTGGTDEMRVTVGGNGVDGVRVIAYVAEDYAANASGAEPEAETTTKADGRWTDALNLDEGVEYTIRFTKSGYTFPNATVTP